MVKGLKMVKGCVESKETHEYYTQCHIQIELANKDLEIIVGNFKEARDKNGHVLIKGLLIVGESFTAEEKDIFYEGQDNPTSLNYIQRNAQSEPFTPSPRQVDVEAEPTI
ncbi:hypothetical protein JTB14_007291 [Gonioctena quinquepunctata]|nr:hypothetical protein JTB14_007291 [Gonioctena quinquepunctata]